MTFAAGEKERVWEEKERGEISLVDWMHHGCSVWQREKQTGNDGKSGEKYWTEIRCRSLFKSVH